MGQTLSLLSQMVKVQVSWEISMMKDTLEVIFLKRSLLKLSTMLQKSWKIYTVNKRNVDAMKSSFRNKFFYASASITLCIYMIMAFVNPLFPYSAFYDGVMLCCLAISMLAIFYITAYNYILGGYIFVSYDIMVKRSLDEWFELFNINDQGLQW